MNKFIGSNMNPVIKWVFVLVFAVVTAELDKIPEDEKPTEITSAGSLMGLNNSVSVWINI